MRKISESTVRRLSLYLRFLEQFAAQGQATISSADLAREPTDIAIVVTPAEAAQEVVDRLVRAGVKAILNFAPAQLIVPADVVVKSVNMALELEALSFALANR